jgi:ribosomal protein RSM22 (predicted rRNA methylase)
VELAVRRIIRHPQQRPGLIELETCTPGGVRTVRVPRRGQEIFRAARKASWGSAWG